MMMEPVNCLSEDSALADALSKLEIMEKENAKLRHGINGASDGTSHENVRLKHQNGEVRMLLCAAILEIQLYASYLSIFDYKFTIKIEVND